jgi:hypothetical protein
MSRKSVLVALAFAFVFALPVSLGQAAPPPTPNASTAGASNVSYSSAVLAGSVNPAGRETNYVFQYGPTRDYGTQTPLSPAGSSTKTIRVSESVSGLQPLTTYHYRIVASSAAGTTKGTDRTFTTSAIPLSIAIAGVPDPVVFGSPFSVEGTLSGTGAANHEIVLQANPFPYSGGFKTIGNPEVSSTVVLEGVAVRVTFHARSVGRRGFVRLYGTVAPAEVGALVGFQLLRPGHVSVNEGGTAITASSPTISSFSRVIRIHRRGVYRALIEVPAGAHTSSYSYPILIG